jgi:predicted SAM-dependent methyltransferase
MPRSLTRRIARLMFQRAYRRIARSDSAAMLRNIHLGCGDDIRPRWLNIDLSVPHSRQRGTAGSERSGTTIEFDLQHGLPVPAGSCELIYSSHFFEHMGHGSAIKLLRECFTALRQEGVFRLALPDIPAVFLAYVRKDVEYLELLTSSAGYLDTLPGSETLVDTLNYAVYQNGEHKYIYDAEKLKALLLGIGFSAVRADQFRPEVDPDNALRRQYSMYIEAVK